MHPITLFLLIIWPVGWLLSAITMGIIGALYEADTSTTKATLIATFWFVAIPVLLWALLTALVGDLGELIGRAIKRGKKT
jgi:hypothetical protein